MNSRFPWIRRLLLAATAVALAGCAARVDHDLAGGSDRTAEVALPGHIVAVAVDDRTLNDSTYVFDGRDTRLTLAPGTRRLRLRYMDMIPESDSRQADDVKFVSEPLTLATDLAAGETYRVTAPRPQSPDAARAFAAEPRFALETATGDRVLAEAQAEPPPVPPAAPAAAGNGAAPGALEMLEFWWRQASESERRRFLKRHAD